MSRKKFWNFKFAALRYLVAWAGYAAMRLIVLLPWRVQTAFGRALGRAAYASLGARRHIAARNIAACLPEWAPAARADLLKRHFRSLGLSIVEMAAGWFG